MLPKTDLKPISLAICFAMLSGCDALVSDILGPAPETTGPAAQASVPQATPVSAHASPSSGRETLTPSRSDSIASQRQPARTARNYGAVETVPMEQAFDQFFDTRDVFTSTPAAGNSALGRAASSGPRMQSNPFAK